jgi:hypothetical protein
LSTKGKVELVTHKPIEEKCKLENFEIVGKHFRIEDLNTTLHIFNGLDTIYNIHEGNNQTWTKSVQLPHLIEEEGTFRICYFST